MKRIMVGLVAGAAIILTGACGSPLVNVTTGDVSESAWDCLLGKGYRGDPTDRREALVNVRDADVRWCEQH
ncbi:hypothetical protein [Pseudonocardia sp. NPDC049154]|uniref:hypothetical protein n=1 Tax=Pseudonocardia sp. NPDC049154 TaxID=3155501 RepID=UPI0033C54C83